MKKHTTAVNGLVKTDSFKQQLVAILELVLINQSGLRCSLVVHWFLVPGDCGSNPVGGKTFSFLVFELLLHDCHLVYL